jgi:hypothetical protein
MQAQFMTQTDLDIELSFNDTFDPISYFN